MAFVVCIKERRNEREGREGARFVIEMWRHFRLRVSKFFIVFSLSIYIIVYILSVVNTGKFCFLPILLLFKQFFPLFLTKKVIKTVLRSYTTSSVAKSKILFSTIVLICFIVSIWPSKYGIPQSSFVSRAAICNSLVLII